jgi:hypothetical protein
MVSTVTRISFRKCLAYTAVSFSTRVRIPLQQRRSVLSVLHPTLPLSLSLYVTLSVPSFLKQENRLKANG